MHNTKTITEVALTTGFCDQSHYTKQFENCNDFVRHSDRENGNYALLLVNMMANLLIRGYPHKMDAELSICLFGCDNMFYSCLLISYQ